MHHSIHANLVARAGQGVLILGQPNVGKSSLSYHLVKQDGFSLITDDLVALRIKTNQQKHLIGCLPNKAYLGAIHLKNRGFVRVRRCLTEHQITHIIELSVKQKPHYQLSLLEQQFQVQVLAVGAHSWLHDAATYIAKLL